MKIKHIFVPPGLIIPLLFLWVSPATGQQVLYNSGAEIYIQNNETVHIQGGVTNTNSGTFINSGTINLQGDWINNAGNAAFNPVNTGTVVLSGGDQLIAGSSVTNFNNITLAGTGVKTLGINAMAEDVLALGDRELATEQFVLTCNSTAATAVTRTSGFVSSRMGGNLSRKTASNSAYLFPVGTSSPVLRYRPVQLTPTISSLNTFAVALISGDPGAEGFSVLSFAPPICIVNPNYFYAMDRTDGIAPVELSIFFDNAADGDYSMISQWQTTQWQNSGTATLTQNTPPALSSLSLANFNSFASPYFDIASTAISGLQLITQSNDTLFASPALTYQWYFNGNPMSGATNSFIVPAQEGSYTVLVTTSGNCSVTSAPYIFSFAGIEGNAAWETVTVYPNPFTNMLTIEGYADGHTRFSLTDILGRQVTESVSHTGAGFFKVELSTPGLPQGMYFLRLETEKQEKIYKLIRL